jgi:hypothetical protein
LAFATLLKQSYNVYTLAQPYFQSTTGEKQGTDKGSARPSTETAAINTPSSGKQKTNGLNPPVKEQSAESGYSLAQSPAELGRHLEMTLADVAKHPASSWKEQPNELPLQVIELMEVEQTLRSLPETEADKMATTSQGQVIGAVEDGTKGFASGGPVGAAKEVLKDTLHVAHLGDDGPLGGRKPYISRTQN